VGWSRRNGYCIVFMTLIAVAIVVIAIIVIVTLGGPDSSRSFVICLH
jgi:hypothetical protein